MFNIAFDELNKVMGALNSIPNICAAATKSWYRKKMIDLHITHLRGTKEHAIFELYKILRVDFNGTTGIGDGLNDLHLFRAVDRKVAMGNADSVLKYHADTIIDSIENDGLAKFLKQTLQIK